MGQHKKYWTFPIRDFKKSIVLDLTHHSSFQEHVHNVVEKEDPDPQRQQEQQRQQESFCIAVAEHIFGCKERRENVFSDVYQVNFHRVHWLHNAS